MSKIMMDDIELLKGDSLSIGIIYKNLTGENFKGEKHIEYLSMMKKELNININVDKLTVL